MLKRGDVRLESSEDHSMALLKSEIIVDQDALLRRRAAQVIPGGMYGHLRAEGLPAGYPQFFARGQGCRLWDVNGREYIDFMCSWGPGFWGTSIRRSKRLCSARCSKE